MMAVLARDTGDEGAWHRKEGCNGLSTADCPDRPLGTIAPDEGSENANSIWGKLSIQPALYQFRCRSAAGTPHRGWAGGPWNARRSPRFRHHSDFAVCPKPSRATLVGNPQAPASGRTGASLVAPPRSCGRPRDRSARSRPRNKLCRATDEMSTTGFGLRLLVPRSPRRCDARRPSGRRRSAPIGSNRCPYPDVF